MEEQNLEKINEEKSSKEFIRIEQNASLEKNHENSAKVANISKEPNFQKICEKIKEIREYLGLKKLGQQNSHENSMVENKIFEEPNLLKRRKYKTSKKDAKQQIIEEWLKLKGSSNPTLKSYCLQKDINYYSMLRFKILFPKFLSSFYRYLKISENGVKYENLERKNQNICVKLNLLQKMNQKLILINQMSFSKN